MAEERIVETKSKKQSECSNNGGETEIEESIAEVEVEAQDEIDKDKIETVLKKIGDVKITATDIMRDESSSYVLPMSKHSRNVTEATEFSFVTQDTILNASELVLWADLPRELWIKIAKRVGGRGVVRLTGTCRLFKDFVMNDDIWKGAFFVDIGVCGRFIDNMQVNTSWHDLYFRSFLERPSDLINLTVISCTKVGAFVVDTGAVLLTHKLTSPEDVSVEWGRRFLETKLRPPLVVEDVKEGIWIVDFYEATCQDGEGRFLMLDARHCEEERQGIRGVFVYFGTRFCEVTETSLSVFDAAHVHDEENLDVLQADWREGPGLCSFVTFHAVATNRPLEEHRRSKIGYSAQRVDDKLIRLKMQQWW